MFMRVNFNSACMFIPESLTKQDFIQLTCVPYFFTSRMLNTRQQMAKEIASVQKEVHTANNLCLYILQ